MVNAIRRKLVVLEPGHLDIEAPEFTLGLTAEVIVLLESPSAEVPPLSQLWGAARGLFKTPAEVDEYLNRERDSWGA